MGTEAQSAAPQDNLGMPHSESPLASHHDARGLLSFIGP